MEDPFTADNISAWWFWNNCPGIWIGQGLDFMIHGFFPFGPIDAVLCFREGFWIICDGVGC